MPNLLEADLDLLQTLITKLDQSHKDVVDADVALQSAYHQFIDTFQSPRKSGVEDEFHGLATQITQGTKAQLTMYEGFQQMLTDLLTAEGTQHPI
jgi:hypothetical protein